MFSVGNNASLLESLKIRRAAEKTREWAKETYGESALNALAKRGLLTKKDQILDFETREDKLAEVMGEKFIDKVIDALSGY